jgi:hypothetical protein
MLFEYEFTNTTKQIGLFEFMSSKPSNLKLTFDKMGDYTKDAEQKVSSYDTVICYLRLVMPKRRRTSATTVKMFIEPSSNDTGS